jgi:hypothetical protein
MGQTVCCATECDRAKELTVFTTTFEPEGDLGPRVFWLKNVDDREEITSYVKGRGGSDASTAVVSSSYSNASSYSNTVVSTFADLQRCAQQASPRQLEKESEAESPTKLHEAGLRLERLGEAEDDEESHQLRKEDSETSGQVESKGQMFFYRVKRENSEEALGMDAKHMNGVLEVLRIMDDGCVARTNLDLENTVEKKPLRIGDLIVQVNNSCVGDTHEMVNECQQTAELIFTVVRRANWSENQFSSM